jgi:hypothetical protein
MPRWFLVPSGLGALLALVLSFVPLFDLLAYEFSFALGLFAAVSSMFVGLGVARSTTDGPGAIGRAALAGAMHLLPALLVISANGLFVRNCNYSQGLAFFLVLPICSAAYSAAAGGLIGQLWRQTSARRRGAAAAIFLLVPIGWSLWSLYWQPPIVVYDHLWGHFAGSLYDEVITLDARLLVFRAGTLLRIAAIALLAWAYTQRLRRGPLFPSGVVAVVAVLLMTFETALGPRLGFRVERDDILRELSAVEVRPGIVLHLPPNLEPARRRAIADDHAFRLEQLTHLFEVELEQPIHSFVYADAQQKSRLQGGRGTMIAKPWLFEIHIHDAVAPHPVVAHELAHVVAASFASGPLRVSNRMGVLVNMGLVEGLAEAVTAPRGDLDLSAWSRALFDLGLAPDMRAILGPGGFWKEAPRRAYTVAGSFVRYLMTTRGAGPLKLAYAGGDFEAAYGQSLDSLVAAWEAHLRAMPLAAFELRLAEEQFKTPSIFSRPCAHEIAALREEAQRAAPSEAVAYLREICRHLDDAPHARFDLAMAHLRAGESHEFEELARALVDRRELTTSQRGQLEEALGDLAWERGDHAGARARFLKVREMALGPGSDRMQTARVWALGKAPELSETLRRFLRDKLPAPAAVLALDQAWKGEPRDPMFPYLIARQLVRAEALEPALPYLDAAAGNTDPLFEAERLRLRAECLARLGKPDDARRALESYIAAAPTSGERARALDELERLRWQSANHVAREP